MRCINCNKEIPDDALLCPYCGRSKKEDVVIDTKNVVINKYILLTIIVAFLLVLVIAIIVFYKQMKKDNYSEKETVSDVNTFQDTQSEQEYSFTVTDRGASSYEELIDILSEISIYQTEEEFEETLKLCKDYSYQYYILNDKAKIEVKDYEWPCNYLGYSEEAECSNAAQDQMIVTFCGRLCKAYKDNSYSFDGIPSNETQYSPQQLLKMEEKIKDACGTEVHIQSVIIWDTPSNSINQAFVKIDDRWFVGNTKLGLLIDFDYD